MKLTKLTQTIIFICQLTACIASAAQNLPSINNEQVADLALQSKPLSQDELSLETSQIDASDLELQDAKSMKRSTKIGIGILAGLGSVVAAVATAILLSGKKTPGTPDTTKYKRNQGGDTIVLVNPSNPNELNSSQIGRIDQKPKIDLFNPSNAAPIISPIPTCKYPNLGFIYGDFDYAAMSAQIRELTKQNATVEIFELNTTIERQPSWRSSFLRPAINHIIILLNPQIFAPEEDNILSVHDLLFEDAGILNVASRQTNSTKSVTIVLSCNGLQVEDLKRYKDCETKIYDTKIQNVYGRTTTILSSGVCTFKTHTQQPRPSFGQPENSLLSEMLAIPLQPVK